MKATYIKFDFAVKAAFGRYFFLSSSCKKKDYNAHRQSNKKTLIQID
jgi:hypothetical protein